MYKLSIKSEDGKTYSIKFAKEEFRCACRLLCGCWILIDRSVLLCPKHMPYLEKVISEFDRKLKGTIF